VRLAEARLLECSSCGSWTYWPRQSSAAQQSLHDSADYFDHPYFELRRRISPSLRRRCRQTFARIGRAIDVGALRGQPLVDVGCDTGVFLQCAAEEFGVKPIGIDVARRAVEQAQQAGIEAYHSPLEDAPEHLRELPLIVAIDLVEHVADPGAFLRAIRSRLRAGGVAYLETPNIASKVYRLGGWLSSLSGGRPAPVFDRLFPPQHIQYFTRQSFVALAQDSGLQIASVQTRSLPLADIAASSFVRLSMGAIQSLDLLSGSHILICAVLRRD
jgi:SAM-dependent methyltransferase